MICKLAAKNEQNSLKIEDCYTGIQLIKRDTNEAYQLAAECRNELARLHMAERKGANNE